jgi:hypothetical protein
MALVVALLLLLRPTGDNIGLLGEAKLVLFG